MFTRNILGVELMVSLCSPTSRILIVVVSKATGQDKDSNSKGHVLFVLDSEGDLKLI